MFDGMASSNGILASILSILAAVVSVAALFYSKRQIYAHVIATNRFRWMEDVRAKYTEFISIYCDTFLQHEKKVQLLKQKKFEIELYFDNRFKEYQDISRALYTCIDLASQGKTDIPAELICSIQRTFSNTHKRAKREAGITASMEKRMRREILGKNKIADKKAG